MLEEQATFTNNNNPNSPNSIVTIIVIINIKILLQIISSSWQEKPPLLSHKNKSSPN